LELVAGDHGRGVVDLGPAARLLVARGDRVEDLDGAAPLLLARVDVEDLVEDGEVARLELDRLAVGAERPGGVAELAAEDVADALVERDALLEVDELEELARPLDD